MEKLAWNYIEQIRKMGEGSMLRGVLKGIEDGFFVKEISRAAAEYQRDVEEGRRTIVGVNRYTIEEKLNIPILKVDEEVQRKQIERLRRIKAERDDEAVKEALNWLRSAAENDENVMPAILQAVKVYATEGEIMGVLKEVYGTYRKPVII